MNHHPRDCDCTYIIRPAYNNTMSARVPYDTVHLLNSDFQYVFEAVEICLRCCSNFSRISVQDSCRAGPTSVLGILPFTLIDITRPAQVRQTTREQRL